MKILNAILLVLFAGCFSFQICGQKNPPATAGGAEFLERFVGDWIGEGESDGKKVRDEMRFEWTLDKRFLKMNYRALSGDSYKGEGYIWFNDERKHYEFYEFNNGRWAVRQGVGKIVNDGFLITEQRKDVRIQILFEFVDSDSIRITESYVRKKGSEPFVTLTFHRKKE